MLSVILTFCSGRVAEGLLLVMNQDSMRVVLEGDGDAVELRRVEGTWRTEDHHPVDFDVLLTEGRGNLDLCEETQPRVMTAGCA